MIEAEMKKEVEGHDRGRDVERGRDQERGRDEERGREGVRVREKESKTDRDRDSEFEGDIVSTICRRPQGMSHVVGGLYF